MTCEKDGDLLAIEVCPNDEKVVAGVENIIKQSAAQQGVQWIWSLPAEAIMSTVYFIEETIYGNSFTDSEIIFACLDEEG